MANKVTINRETGLTLYAIIHRPADLYVWDTGDAQFEDPGTSFITCSLALLAALSLVKLNVLRGRNAYLAQEPRLRHIRNLTTGAQYPHQPLSEDRCQGR